MDPITGAATGIAVASITIQLADQLKKIYDFWNSWKDAPEDIRSLVKDLELLLSVLDQIRKDEEQLGTDQTTTAILRSCESQVDSCMTVLKDLERGLVVQSRRIRRWSVLRTLVNKGNLKKFHESLQSTKMTLMLALQSLARYVVCRCLWQRSS